MQNKTQKNKSDVLNSFDINANERAKKKTNQNTHNFKMEIIEKKYSGSGETKRKQKIG